MSQTMDQLKSYVCKTEYDTSIQNDPIDVYGIPFMYMINEEKKTLI